MSNDKVRINVPSPANEGETYHGLSGNVYEVDKHMKTAIYAMRSIPFVDLMLIMGVSHTEISEQIQERKAHLCDRALKYLKDTDWSWAETGEKVSIDKDFLADFLDQDVTKRTVYRRLKERRMTLNEVKKIVKFFEGNHLVQTNRNLF